MTLKMNCYWNQISCAFVLLIASMANIAAFQITPAFRNSNGMRKCSSLAPNELSVRPTGRTKLFYYDREADGMEEMVGGVRYEMVELPDSMVDFTIFVGNLCEFVTDEMLSDVFRKGSSLNFVPACVARKPNSSSLKYGFVTFPTVEEKEAAIIRFTGHLVNDRPLRLETIIDYEYRVRVPEKLVLYTVGESKKTRDGTRNTMRMAQNSRELPKREKKDRRSKPSSRTDYPQDRDRGKKKKFQRKQNRKRNNDLSSWSM